MLTVDMDEVKFCDFGTSTNAIGTRNLKGCHVVVIFSSRGAILAHIAPGSEIDQSEDLEMMGKHILDNMKDVYSMYRQNESFFPKPGSETHTVHAWLGGEIASPGQRDIIAEALVRMGLPKPTSYGYDIDPRANPAPDDSKGTVVLLGSSPPRLLVEDKIVAPKGQQLTSSAALNAGPSTNPTPRGVPSNHTGWVHINGTYYLYKNGIVAGAKSAFPPGQSVYDPNGWAGTGKSWARYVDGKFVCL